jgi:hypothetical protein
MAMNLYEKIQAVSSKIKNIEKNLQVGTGSYSYKAVSDIDVVIAVKEAEEEFRLVSIPIKQELVNSEVIRTLNKDNRENLTYVDNIKMTLRITDLDDITMFIDIETYGKGIDSSDKGFGKASTYARKYALLNAYKIATGSDPDQAKSEQKEAAPTIGEKKLAVINYLENNLKSKELMLEHFKVQELGDLTESQFGTIYKTYKAKNLL